jgi:DNA-binding transcriptional LysR family regulator
MPIPAKPIDLGKTALFVRVVQTGSFTAAAHALELPKSSVSRGVSGLEEELGVRLLHRTTRRLQLTSAGRAYFERAARALEELADAGAVAADMDKAPRGVIRVTAPVDLGTWVLAPVIANFVRLYPLIRIDLSLGSRTVDLVEEGFDLAVRAGRLRDSSLVARRLGPTDLSLFASPAYLKRKGNPRSVADLAKHDCILFRASSGSATWSFQGPAGVEHVEVSGPISVDDFVFVRQAALAGAGIAHLPRFHCSFEIERGRLVPLLPGYVTRLGALHLVYPSSRHLPHRVALFRDHIIAGFKEIFEQDEA